MATNGARRGPSRETKHRIAVANQQEGSFYQQTGIKFNGAQFCVVLKLGHGGK
jgi:hypothetical protein